MKKMGATTICVKDMAGVMGPQEAYDITKALNALESSGLFN